MRGELTSGKHAKRHPYDWYVDEPWCARQLAQALGGFRREREAGLAIWDPCAGYGNTLQAAHELGLEVFASDIVNNIEWSNFATDGDLAPLTFRSGDFLEATHVPTWCSIVCNPPYSYLKVQGVLISELFARKALALATGRVCILVPSKWLSSQSRYRLFADHPPAAVLHLSQRPSMPPGDRIAEMGSRAFRGGMTDYCWIVWDVEQPTARHFTRTIWLPRLTEPVEPIEGLA